MLSWINSYNPFPGPFLFLDRDGVINRDSPDYIKGWNEFHFYPDALEALAWLQERHVNVIVISNQSALNRGMISHEDFWDMHTRMIRGIEAAGGTLLAACYCPHRPDENCRCRKPAPGMIEEIRRLFHIPSEGCIFIGDRSSDILAAERGGCIGVLLDRSARPGEAPYGAVPPSEGPLIRRATLMAAVRNLYPPSRSDVPRSGSM